MDSGLPALVTIHGVNSDGGWQERLRPVFAPHFKYIPIQYPHYRRFGGTKVLLEPVVLLAGSMIVMGVALLTHVWGWKFGLELLLVVLLAYLASGIRRTLSFRHVVRQFDRRISIGERPHVIAHSLGTFLIGRLMQRPTTRCDRVVFAGSVLAREFLSTGFSEQNGRRFREIRNEVGLRDRVVALAGLVRRMVRDFGDAGLAGFDSDPIHVHDLEGPDNVCASCQKAADRPDWLVHNVRIEDFAHNDHFITPKHALAFWLPYLWEIEPNEFCEWLELCRTAAQVDAPGRLGRGALIAERKLLERSWTWAGGTLADFVQREYPSASSRLNDAVESLLLFRSVWRLVERACDISLEHGGDPVLMGQARALEPRVAFQIALALGQTP